MKGENNVMDFFRLAEERFSIRSFTDRPVEKESIEAILRAGQVAPTACNLQPQKILVIQSDEALVICLSFFTSSPLI